MGKNYRGSLGFTSSPGLSNRICKASCSNFTGKITSSVPSCGGSARSGSASIAGKAGSASSGSQSSDRRLYKFDVCSPKKGWGKLPGSEPETLESISSIRALQDGGHPHVTRPFTTRGVLSEDRSEGCLFDSTHLEKSSEISSLSLARKHARVCLPSFRLSHSAKGFHKIDETSSGTFEGHSSNNLFRRYPNYGRISGSGASPCSIGIESSREPGVSCQLQEIPLSSQSTNRIFRFVDRFQGPYSSASWGKIAKDSKELPETLRATRGLNKGIIKIPGAPDLIHPSHFPSSPPFQASATSEKSGHELTKIVRGHDPAGPSVQGGDHLVERSSPSMEWPCTVPETSRSHHRNRCVTEGMGGILPRYKYRGSMVLRRKEVPYKLSRTSGRVTGNQDLHKRQNVCTCEAVNGQCSGSSIHKQDGGYSFPSAIKFSIRPLGMVHSQQDGGFSAASSRMSECSSGQRVPSFTRFQRLETGPSHVSIAGGEMGPPRDRPVCFTPNLPTPTICQLETGPLSGSCRCLFNQLEKHSGVCLSSICLNRSLPTAGNESGGGPISSSSPGLASSALVPSATSSVHRLPSVIPDVTNTSDEG